MAVQRRRPLDPYSTVDGDLGPYSTASSTMTLLTAQISHPHFSRRHIRTLETTVLTAFPLQIRNPLAIGIATPNNPEGRSGKREGIVDFHRVSSRPSRLSMGISPHRPHAIGFPTPAIVGRHR